MKILLRCAGIMSLKTTRERKGEEMNKKFYEKCGPICVGWGEGYIEVHLLIPERNIADLDYVLCPGYVTLTSGGARIVEAPLDFEFFSDEVLDIIQGTPKQIFIARLNVSSDKLVKYDTFLTVTFGELTSEPVPVPVL